MTRTCPQGHTSSTDDFCDVCGSPISEEPQATAPTPAPAPAPAAPATPSSSLTLPPAGGEPRQCPNCQAVNSADALFCEDCGYDFATGQLPPPPVAIDPASGQVRAAADPGAPPAGRGAGFEWVAEVWVDPDWFAHQRAEGTCPTSGLPTVVPLKGTVAMIGRRSRGRNINPEVDCPGDSAISHRHAELRRTAERWSVKDLGSTNGTFVGRPGAGYPDDAVPEQQARELDADERIYLGAWTRIVVRKATDAERAGT